MKKLWLFAALCLLAPCATRIEAQPAAAQYVAPAIAAPTITVAGAVHEPGKFPIVPGEKVTELLKRAGGANSAPRSPKVICCAKESQFRWICRSKSRKISLCARATFWLCPKVRRASEFWALSLVPVRSQFRRINPILCSMLWSRLASRRTVLRRIWGKSALALCAPIPKFR